MDYIKSAMYVICTMFKVLTIVQYNLFINIFTIIYSCSTISHDSHDIKAITKEMLINNVNQILKPNYYFMYTFMYVHL